MKKGGAKSVFKIFLKVKLILIDNLHCKKVKVDLLFGLFPPMRGGG